MRAHVLHHVPFELTGNIGAWLASRQATVTETHFWEPHLLPDPGDIDLLVVMGGPMSVNDESTLSWLADEKAFIRDAIAGNTPTLGLCLGSQLIASAHGARVGASPYAEHGWFEVVRVEASASCFRFPDRFTTFHSHGETFELPDGAVHLARSEGCANQAFQLGDRAIGIQFHLESTAESAGAIVEECGGVFAAGPFVQRGEELRTAPRGVIEENARLMHALLDYLIR